MIGQVIINGLVAGSIYVLFAAGLAIVLGVLDIPNFAHSQTFMLGAFASFFMITLLGTNFFVASAISFILMAVLGVGLEKVFFRPLRGQPHVSLLISAIAALLLFENTAALLFGDYNRMIPTPYAAKQIDILGASISMQRLLVIVVSVVLIIGLQFFIKYTKLGRGVRAMGQNMEVSQLMGINVDRMSSFIFALTAGLSSVAGSLLGSLFLVGPHMGLEPLLKGIVIIVLGGTGSIAGAIVGGYIIGITESITVSVFGSAFKNALPFILLIIILAVKPTGLFGYLHGGE